MKEELVYIVILHYNNFRCTDFCLESLRHVKDVAFKVVLVDNASKDGSFDAILEKYAEVHAIRNRDNLGFARGTNVGLRYALEKGGDYFLLLNNDVEVTPGFLKPMILALQENPDIGIVTSKVLYRQQHDLIWHAGGYIRESSMTGIARGYDEKDVGQYDTPDFTRWASGACCLCTRRLLEKNGLLNEQYFFGQEEWDFSSDAIRSNFLIRYEPASVVYHEIGQSSNKSPSLYAYQLTYNKFTYARKFLSLMAFWAFTTKYVVYLVAAFPKKDLHTADNSSDFYLATAKRAALWGVRDFFKGVTITANHLANIDQELMRWWKK